MAKQELQRQDSMPLKIGETAAFVAAVRNQRIINCNVERLKEVLRLCMLKVGLRAKNLPTAEEKAVLLAHVTNNYGNHTPDEIVLAFDMAISGKLEVDATCYENFSCLYVSSIMNAYRKWAAQEAKYLSNIKKELPKPEGEPMNDNEVIEMYRKVYEAFKKIYKEGDPKRYMMIDVSRLYTCIVTKLKEDNKMLTKSQYNIYMNRANIVMNELQRKDAMFCRDAEDRKAGVQQIARRLVAVDYFENNLI